MYSMRVYVYACIPPDPFTRNKRHNTGGRKFVRRIKFNCPNTALRKCSRNAVYEAFVTAPGGTSASSRLVSAS